MIGDLVARLIAAGTPPEVAATIVAEAVAVGMTMAPKPDAQASERSKHAEAQARYRSKKKASPVITRDHSDHQVTEVITGDASSAPQEVPPHPPKTPPIPVPDGTANAAADAAHSEPVDPEKQLFDRGKQVLGKSAGGLIAKLLQAKGRNIALARAAIETASTKENPREYVSRIIGNAKGDAPNGKRSHDSYSALNAALAAEFLGGGERGWPATDYDGPSLELTATSGGRASRQ